MIENVNLVTEYRIRVNIVSGKGVLWLHNHTKYSFKNKTFINNKFHHSTTLKWNEESEMDLRWFLNGFHYLSRFCVCEN